MTTPPDARAFADGKDRSDMMRDSEADLLYLADALPKSIPGFHARLSGLLAQAGITTRLLPGTRDIWARDFMPIQTRLDRFVQFRYDPSYLRSPRWRHLRSDSERICREIGLATIPSPLRVDGGNVVRGPDRIVMCDRIFRENPEFTAAKVVRLLEEAFETDRLVFVPTDPEDPFGHADGVVRFIDADTVAINGTRKMRDYDRALMATLRRSGLEWVTIPYNPYSNRTWLDATGCYLNFLEMRQAIFVPSFDISEDETALQRFEELYPGRPLVAVPARSISSQGGVLNCISWAIKAPESGLMPPCQPRQVERSAMRDTPSAPGCQEGNADPAQSTRPT